MISTNSTGITVGVMVRGLTMILGQLEGSYALATLIQPVEKVGAEVFLWHVIWPYSRNLTA